MIWELRYYKKPKDAANIPYKEEKENYDYIVLGSFDTLYPEIGFCYRWFTLTKNVGKKLSDEYEIGVIQTSNLYSIKENNMLKKLFDFLKLESLNLIIM